MLRGLPTQFWFLWTGTLINRLGAFIILYLALYLTGERGLSPAFAGLVVGLYSGGGALGVVLGGILADRWGRRPTLVTALFTAAALMVALSAAREPLMIAVCASAVGFSSEAIRPALGAMIVDVVPATDRTRAFALHYWAINIGFAGSALIGGLAAQVDFRLLFLLDAATTAAFGVVAMLFLRESRPVLAEGSAPSTAGLSVVLRDRVYLAFLGCILAAALVFSQPTLALPISMSRDGLSPSMFGLVLSVNGLMIVAGQLFVPKLIGNRRPSRVIALASVITGVGFGATALADTAPLYAFTVIVWTVGEMLGSPSSATLLAELSPVAHRGRYQGMFSLAFQIAGFSAPIIGGLVQQHSGDAPLWIGCLVVCLAAAAAHLALEPGRRRRAAEIAAGEPSAVPA